jgi:hypothetical protein
LETHVFLFLEIQQVLFHTELVEIELLQVVQQVLKRLMRLYNSVSILSNLSESSGSCFLISSDENGIKI